MPSPSCLPSASRGTLVRVFDEVFKATDVVVFTQKTLREKGFGQYRQALALMNFLDLLSSSGLLKRDIVDSRMHRKQFAELMHKRVRQGCLAAGCTEDDIKFLGAPDKSESEIHERIQALTPIRNQRTPAAQSNMTCCLRALHDFLAASCDRDWIEKECRILEKPHHQKQGDQRLDPIRKRSISPAPITSLSALMAGADVTETKKYVVGFDEHEEPVYAYVSLEHPVDPQHLLRLAKQLLDEQAMMTAPGKSRPATTR